ncbi:MAG: hypothetical protein ACJ790_09265 [Myxococcaceae bacterium]
MIVELITACALAVTPVDPDALLQKAQQQTVRKDWKGAEKSYALALSARPDDVASRFKHAEALIKLKKKDAALSELKLAVDQGFQDAAYLDAAPEFESLHENARWSTLIDDARENEARASARRQAMNAKLQDADAALQSGEADKARAALSALKPAEMPEQTAYEVLRARAAASDSDRASAIEAAIAAGLVDPSLVPADFASTEQGKRLVEKVRANRSALERSVEWTRAGGEDPPAIIGLVADGQEGKTVAASLEKAFPRARIVVPTPPFRLSGKGRAWIDLQRTEAVLDVMFSTVKADRALLVGFGQGAQLALREAVARPHRYSGVIVIGAPRFDPFPDDALESAAKAGLRVVVLASGSDPVAMRTNNEAVVALANGGIPTQKFVAVGLVAEVPPAQILQEAKKFLDTK